MIGKFVLLLLLLQLIVGSQLNYGDFRNLRESNMMDVNQQQNMTKLSSLVPSHNKPVKIIASNIQRQQHRNDIEGTKKNIPSKNVTFVQEAQKNVAIEHVTAEYRSKTQIVQSQSVESETTNKTQNKAKLNETLAITPIFSNQRKIDLKDQKQLISQVKQNLAIRTQPSNISHLEGKNTQKSLENNRQIQNQKRQIQLQKRQNLQNHNGSLQSDIAIQQTKDVLTPKQKITYQQKKSVVDRSNKTASSEISIQIIQSPTQQSASEQNNAINTTQSVINDKDEPQAVEILKVLQEIKIQNITIEPKTINQTSQIAIIEPLSQKIQEQIKIIQMDNDDQDLRQQRQKSKSEELQPQTTVSPSSTIVQLKETPKQTKQGDIKPTVIEEKNEKIEDQQINNVQVDNKNLEQTNKLPLEQIQEDLIEQQSQVKVEIIEINSEDQPQKLQSQQQIDTNQRSKQQQINQRSKQHQTNQIDLGEDLPQIVKQLKEQQQIVNKIYLEPKFAQADIIPQDIIQSEKGPITPNQQVKQISIQQQNIVPAAQKKLEETIKQQQLQVLLTTVKENLEGKAKVDLIEHLQKEIKLTQQAKAMEPERSENLPSIYRQSQYANLKETQAIKKDLQLPPQQNMDAQTVIVIIVLTFIISIPIVKEIRQKPNKNEPQERKQSTNTEMEYPQDNQSGFEVDQTFDQQYLGQINKNPGQRVWQR